MTSHSATADRKALLAKLLKEKTQTYTFPLSYGQQALWVIYSNHPHNLAYNMAWAVEFDGALNVAALRQAVQRLIERHPALRSQISLNDGEPMQTVRPSGECRWLEHLGADHTATTAAQLLQQIYAQPFALTQDNPLRVGLVQRSETGYTVLLVMHHIFGDAESMNILGNELLAMYRAELTGETAQLPTLTSTYPEVVRMEKELLNSSEGEKLLSYWRDTLGDTVPILQLPIDHPRPAEQTYNGAAVTFQLSASLSQQLKALAKQQGITLFPLFLSALHILLHRYTGQSDIWVGSPSSVSRHHPQFAPMVGYLANSVVLRRTFEQPSQLTVQEVFSANRQSVLDAIAHAAYPFMLLVKAIKPKRDLSYSPLFQVMLDFKGRSFLAVTTPEIPGVRVTRIDFPQMEGQFDLTFNIVEGDCFDCTLYYNTDIFEHANIERMSQHWQMVLSSMAAQPQQSIADLPLLSAADIAQLQTWSKLMENLEIPDLLQQQQSLAQEQGYTLVMVAVDGKVSGAIELLPQVRTEAMDVIRYLKQNGKRTCIISGDHEAPTRSLANRLDIDEYFAQVLPQDKAEIIKKLQAAGRTVCFIGDGINDSIALKQAQVSISLTGASSIAVDTAEIILMDQGLTHLPALFEIATRYKKNMDMTFMLLLTPAAISLGGVFLLHFGLAQTIVLNMAGLAGGLGNAMLPVLMDKTEK